MKKELVFFSVLLIGISIGSFGLSILVTQRGILEFGTPLFMLIYGVAGYSPSIAAVITIKRYQGNTSLKQFGMSIINVKQGVRMYLYACLAPFALWTGAYLVSVVLGTEGSIFRNPFYAFLWLVPAMIIGGGLEEIGWRGYLLPKLLERLSPTVVTLIIGVVWSVWHLPMWLVVGAPQQSFDFLPFALGCIATSFLMTPLYIKTRSIWLCILLHAVGNACFYVFSISLDNSYITAISTLILATLIYYVMVNARLKKV